MDPIIVDPSTYDKENALKTALSYVEGFLRLNAIDSPDYIFTPDESKKPPGANPWHNKGWCWNRTVFVNVKRARPPVKVPGFAWSFTGFKADLTVAGVLAHEVGHHVHFSLLPTRSSLNVYDVRKALHGEPSVSGYEPNQYEVFAEAMRLFILNPDLLRIGRPKRYELIVSAGLKPVHAASWREVLSFAHPKIINAADSWIKKSS